MGSHRASFTAAVPVRFQGLRFQGANMPSLSFTSPKTVDEAVKILAGASGMAKVLAGGTDLLVQLRSGRVKPELIVDTKKIPELIGIREECHRFVIVASPPGVLIHEHT